MRMRTQQNTTHSTIGSLAKMGITLDDIGHPQPWSSELCSVACASASLSVHHELEMRPGNSFVSPRIWLRRTIKFQLSTIVTQSQAEKPDSEMMGRQLPMLGRFHTIGCDNPDRCPANEVFGGAVTD